jgi:hypothetical protein
LTHQPADFDRETFHNVQRYGALGNAHTLDTAAFQAAIDTCHEQGGGTVWVPAGQYVTGTIFFHDNITLHLDAGATLLGSPDPVDYPVLPNRWEGEQQPACTLECGHGGIIIGSEMSGGVQNVVVSNCVFIGTDRGIRLKSRRGRGGTVENVRISNLIMDGVLCPFTMNLYYGCGAWGDEFVSDKSAKTLDASTPRFRHIHISHVIARNAKIAAGFIYGLSEMPIEDISLSDISVSFTDGAEPHYPEMADGLEKMLRAGFFIRNTHHIRLDHVEVTNQIGMAFDLGNSTDVEINASGTSTPDHSAPIFRLQNLSDICIHHCRAMGAGLFLHFEGSKHNFQYHLTLTGNVIAPEQIKFVEIPITAGHL